MGGTHKAGDDGVAVSLLHLHPETCARPQARAHPSPLTALKACTEYQTVFAEPLLYVRPYPSPWGYNRYKAGKASRIPLSTVGDKW